MISDLGVLLTLLDDRTRDHSWGTGYQVVVAKGDDVILNASGGVDGAGKPVSNESLFPIYCAGKPVTALAIGALVDHGELSFEDVLGDVLPGELNPRLATTSIEQLLTHTAGLWPYSAGAFFTLSRSSRRQAVRRVEPALQSENVGHYADFVSWELLAMVIEELTGESFVQAVDDLVIAPCGLGNDLMFAMTTESSSYRRLRINVDVQTGAPIPLIWERSPSNLGDVRPSGGAIATMCALSELYRVLLSLASGDAGGIVTSVIANELIRSRTVAGKDKALGRVCRYSRGFMTDLSLPHLGTGLGDRTFGHSGLHGMTFAAADPCSGASFAVHVNGVTRHDQPYDGEPDRSPVARRRLICKLIADALRVDQS